MYVWKKGKKNTKEHIEEKVLVEGEERKHVKKRERENDYTRQLSFYLRLYF